MGRRSSAERTDPARTVPDRPGPDRTVPAGNGPAGTGPADRPRPAVFVALTAVCALSGATINLFAHQWDPVLWWHNLPCTLVAASFLAGGAVTWGYGPMHRLGLLSMCYGCVAMIGDLKASPLEPVHAVGVCLTGLAWAVGAQMVLSVPDGRLGSGRIRALVAAIYLCAVGTSVLRYLLGATRAGNTLLGQEASIWTQAGDLQVMVIGLGIAALLGRRWLTATEARRRSSTILVAGAITWCLGSFSLALANWLRAPTAVEPQLLVGLLAVEMLVVAGALLWELRQTTAVHARLAALATDLGPEPSALRLERALAAAIGDPGLRMTFGDPARPDPARPDPGPTTATDRSDLAALAALIVGADEDPEPTRTPVRLSDGSTAVIEHDRVLSPALAALTAATAVVAIERLRLADLRRAPSAPLPGDGTGTGPDDDATATADAERRRLQRDVHDGVQHPLLAAAVFVELARDQLGRSMAGSPAALAVDRAGQRLADAVAAVREFAVGGPPRLLAEHGLAAAVTDLCARSPIPTTVRTTAARWPESIELAAWFVVSEALSNVFRHADARAVTVTVREDAGRLHVEVDDDGRGGVLTEAEQVTGTGLRSLRERVTAVRGVLTVHSRPGRGTRVHAAFPLRLELSA